MIEAEKRRPWLQQRDRNSRWLVIKTNTNYNRGCLRQSQNRARRAGAPKQAKVIHSSTQSNSILMNSILIARPCRSCIWTNWKPLRDSLLTRLQSITHLIQLRRRSTACSVKIRRLWRILTPTGLMSSSLALNHLKTQFWPSSRPCRHWKASTSSTGHAKGTRTANSCKLKTKIGLKDFRSNRNCKQRNWRRMLRC